MTVVLPGASATSRSLSESAALEVVEDMNETWLEANEQSDGVAKLLEHQKPGGLTSTSSPGGAEMPGHRG